MIALKGMRLTLCAALGLSSGCKAPSNDAPGAPAASASSAPLAVASAAHAARQKPWFGGNFSGQYEAKVVPVEIKTGAIREWTTDDGKLSSGPGKLTFTVSDDGIVEGAREGALGASRASGKVEDDTLRLQLSPNDATGLRGVLVANRAGDGFKGTIRASSTDSLRVREASIELEKQAN